MALYGATVGKLGVLGMDAATNQAVCAIFPDQSCNRDYLFFFLLKERDALLQTSFGGAQPNINQEIVRQVLIPLAPLGEQKRIAAILTEQMATVDRTRAAAQAQCEAAKALPAACLRTVFSSPESQRWPVKRLGEVLRLRKEIVHPRDNPSGPSTFVGLEHVEPCTGKRIGSLPVEMSQLTGRKPRFHRGDIVYGYLRPYLNKVWVAEFDGLCSVDQYVYSVPTSLADTEYVAWFMRSDMFLRRAPVGDAPAWLPRIRIDEVAATRINLPPLEEQHCMAAILNEQMASAERARDAIEEELDAINKLPAALLRRAFSGQVW